ncbi:MAG: flagellar biosynthesis anti-sigma factor FlgM [Desulfobaccales bacterium]
MKITDIQGTGVSQLQSEQTGSVGSRAGKTSTENQSAGNDNIVVSQQARLMQKAGEAISQAPDVRQDKVDPLQQAINQGTYSHDTQKVANSMIASMLMER